MLLCYVIQGYITIFSSTKLDQAVRLEIENAIRETIITGDIASVDKRFLDITWTGFDNYYPSPRIISPWTGFDNEYDPSPRNAPLSKDTRTPNPPALDFEEESSARLFGMEFQWWAFILTCIAFLYSVH